MTFVESSSKQDAVDRLHRLIGIAPEPLGPGSKERKATFVAVAHALAVPVDPSDPKPGIAAAICEHLGGKWDERCESSGETITLRGLNQVVRVVEAALVGEGAPRTVIHVREEEAVDLAFDTQEGEALPESEVGLAIAEQIAALSQATYAPSEFEPAPRSIDPDAVDLRSSSWMAHLASVQGWLRLPEDLPLDEPRRFLETLAVGLGVEGGVEEPTLEGGVPTLSEAGLDRLSGRLQRALQLQEAFQADLEVDGGSLASATGRWLSAWEEEDADEDESAGPVTAKALTWNINEFSDRASRGKLNLSPSYQRSDVWPTTDAQMLIESILRGIPLPSVIILKSSGDAPYEVVDGKQRLTAILRFMGKHPKALEVVKAADEQHPDARLSELFEKDYPRFRRAWKNATGDLLTATREREHYFPFKLRTGSSALKGQLAPLQGKYYTEIRDVSLEIADTKVEVAELFERITDYKVPLIEYSKATRRQIHEVFNLYNKQGKHLNAEEIRNALYHDVALMRALIVCSGDNDDVVNVAPFLQGDWMDLQSVGQTLSDYGFGTARYRRTKVLSWLAALTLADSLDGAGSARRLSTARHIDSLLERIEKDADDPLRDEAAVAGALRLLFVGIEAHAAVEEAWAPQFRDTKAGAKWQELQLVASVLGVTLATAVLDDRAVDQLADAAGILYEASSSEAWKRPKKTQTADQWEYIARVALEVCEAIGVDPLESSEVLRRRFGYSGVPTLQAVVANAKSG